MVCKSQQTTALKAHENRYNQDMALLMERLDNMDTIIHEQGKLLSQLVLKFSEFREGGCEKAYGKRSTEKRGQCLIIQFDRG